MWVENHPCICPSDSIAQMKAQKCVDPPKGQALCSMAALCSFLENCAESAHSIEVCALPDFKKVRVPCSTAAQRPEHFRRGPNPPKGYEGRSTRFVVQNCRALRPPPPTLGPVTSRQLQEVLTLLWVDLRLLWKVFPVLQRRSQLEAPVVVGVPDAAVRSLGCCAGVWVGWGDGSGKPYLRATPAGPQGQGCSAGVQLVSAPVAFGPQPNGSLRPSPRLWRESPVGGWWWCVGGGMSIERPHKTERCTGPYGDLHRGGGSPTAVEELGCLISRPQHPLFGAPGSRRSPGQ